MNGDSNQISWVFSSQPGDAGGLMTIAPPTISIGESPGIHSTAMHAFEKTHHPRHGRAQKPNWQPLAWSPPLL
jgi:hypothetical protein